MQKRDFLKTMAVAGAAVATQGIGSLDVLTQAQTAEGPYDLVAVMGGEPDEMFRKAITELGGMGKFVKKGDKIVIKPNIAWNQPPEVAANTNPILIGEMVKQALAAGAASVLVFDMTCDGGGRIWQECYKKSGIQDAVEAAGGKMLPGNNESDYVEVDLPNAKVHKKTKVHKELVECNAWFNVPVLKVHGGAKLTMAMKNYMGVSWDRGAFHREDLQQCIADACTWEKKPILNIVDAYRIMKANGPRGRSADDAVVAKALFISKDIVAVDTAACKFAERFTNVTLEQASHIGHGEKLGLGTTNLDSIKVGKFNLS